MTKVYTIGFTKKSAEEFFTKLKDAGVTRVIDIRLNNVSQLAGFSKKDDLRYFLDAILGIEYVHRLDLAPTQKILDSYRKQKGKWSAYETRFNALLKERKIEKVLDKSLFDNACLLCSEDEPTHCHRRLVVEYLAKYWKDLEITHIV